MNEKIITSKLNLEWIFNKIIGEWLNVKQKKESEDGWWNIENG